MPRSIKKGPYVAHHVLKKALKSQETGSRTPIKTWARGSFIVPDMVGLVFSVHNGKKHIPVSINESMIGHKLGEFSPTRTFHGHSGNKKTDKKSR